MPRGSLLKPKNARQSGQMVRRPGNLNGRVKEVAIAYDGEKTEHEYFRGWARAIGTGGIVLRPFHVRSGGNALRAVEATKLRIAKEGDFDEVWCVCDADDTTEADLLKAKTLADRNKIKLCLSTRCFEVWLALHWGKMSLACIACEKEAISIVSKHYPNYTAKSKSVPFSVLFPLTVHARENAKWLTQQGHVNPATSMHELADLLISIYASKKR